jgi:DNA mismatch repair ATPase MutS
MSLVTEYLGYQLEYEALYGEKKTVVVLQSGTFYIIMEYDPSKCINEEDKKDDQDKIWDKKIGKASEISSNVLDCVLTQNDKKARYSISNPDLLGFPCSSMDKKLQTLLAHDYLVVRYDQKGDEKLPNGNAVRFCADISSPTMCFNNITLKDLHVHIVSIYIEFIKSKSNHRYDEYLINAGVSCVDIITGQTKITEFYSQDYNEIQCAQELYKFLIAHHPKEIIIHIDDVPDEVKMDYTKYLEKILTLKKYDRYLVKINEVNKEYKKTNYHIEFFNKLYTPNYQLNKNNKIINDLDLEYLVNGRIAFILLIHYCKINNGPIEDIKPPLITWFDENKILSLTHNAALCLDVIPHYENKHKSVNSLFSVMNKTCTKIGERCLQYLLLHPMINKKEIECYYDMIEELNIVIDDKFLWVHIEFYLKGLPDIARLQRKAELNLLTPKDLSLLLRSYDKLKNLIQFIQVQSCPILLNHIFNSFDVYQFIQFVNDYLQLFDLEGLDCSYIEDKKMEFNCNFIHNHIELDHYFNNLLENDKKLDVIHQHLNEFLKKGQLKYKTKKTVKNGKIKKGPVKNDGELTLLTCSTSNANKLLSSPYNVTLCGQLRQSTYSSTDKIISSDIIEQLCHIKDDTKNIIGVKLFEVYQDYIQKIKQLNFFSNLCHFVGKIDVLHNYAKIAYQNKYFKPTIKDGMNSFLKIKEIRHPIIEKIIDGEYITNDIYLGKETEEDLSEYGMLLYGVNMLGKCLDPNTPLIMYNGRTKLAKDILLGDQLMGDDSKARNILCINKGQDIMYKIIPNQGEPFIINGHHILCLKSSGYKQIIKNKNNYKVIWFNKEHIRKYKYFIIKTSHHDKDLYDTKRVYDTEDEAQFYAQQFFDHVETDKDEIIEISLNEYIKKPPYWKLNYSLYRVGIEFNEQSLPIDPYILGCWLGNKTQHQMTHVEIDNLKIYHNHIPDVYKYNSRENRLKLLEGIIDCNINHDINISLKDKRLLEDIIWLIRSLGFDVYKKISTHDRIGIIGEHLKDIPLLKYKIPYQDNFKKVETAISFKIENLGVGDYVGFETDGNKRFLLGDFIVTHNSSLIKAIGLNMIMAQSGSYVPGHLIYKPYTRIMTRLTNQDNLFEGESSYCVELNELKTILKQSHHNSLVIVDELGRSTESQSAICITISSLLHLVNKKSTFVFASHLHEIIECHDIMNLKPHLLKIAHLSVSYHEGNDLLIYHRKLKSGGGLVSYGIEVAKYLKLPSEFIEQCNKIALELEKENKEFLTTKKSRYNAKVYMDQCSLCGTTQNLITHHIVEQHKADHNYIGAMHKNVKDNLIVLCESCHIKKIHAEKKELMVHQVPHGTVVTFK